AGFLDLSAIAVDVKEPEGRGRLANIAYLAAKERLCIMRLSVRQRLRDMIAIGNYFRHLCCHPLEIDRYFRPDRLCRHPVADDVVELLQNVPPSAVWISCNLQAHQWGPPQIDTLAL